MPQSRRPSRRSFLAGACAGLALPGASPARATRATASDDRDDVAAAQRLAGLAFTDDELTQLAPSMREQRASFQALRAHPLSRFTDPAFQFDPVPPGHRAPPIEAPEPFAPTVVDTTRVDDLDLAFASVADLQTLLRRGDVTSRRLTELALARLQRFDQDLLCTVTLMREHALAAADRADAELAAGRPRGPLHGIPFGAKDLLAHPAAPTTFGAEPFREQVLDLTATVLERLERGGAVLVAKLSLGALAMGDRWFKGVTKNPWDVRQGSSGSSAGSAASTAAGLLPFALGSETLGSIVSPAVRCSVAGLRPTFGAVPRYGAMALSWTMDKLGVLARNAEDLALVFEAIRGPDGRDLSTRAAGFAWRRTTDLRGLRVGVLQSPRNDFSGDDEKVFLDFLRDSGVTVVPATLPEFPYGALRTILMVEAAAAFDELTRDGGVRQLGDQSASAWPNQFRAARFVPAVEYVRATRLRTDLMLAVASHFAGLDALVAPTHGGPTLLATNLTGHPALALPYAKGRTQPRMLSLLGPLYGEATMLRIAHAWQQATDHHRRRPALTS